MAQPQSGLGLNLAVPSNPELTCRISRLALSSRMNLARWSLSRAVCFRYCAVLAVSLRLCTKMSTWCLPAQSRTCPPADAHSNCVAPTTSRDAAHKRMEGARNVISKLQAEQATQ